MITSRDNETLTLVRKLLRGRKHRDETGLFAVEGEDLVAAARGAGIEPVHLLVAGETVEPALLARVSTLPHPAREIGVYRRADLPVSSRETCLALWRLADPGNVGALVRTADAFTASVALSDGCADPLSPKALRATAGAIFRVPLVPWETQPGTCVALVAHGGSPLYELDLRPPLTFLLGSERDGVPEELATDCGRVTIPLPGAAESLNVAAAGAIALYQASRSADGDQAP
ncbi:MAG TPA: RNA methyltransferase [Gaiellaceae bacterium]|nr:RNA methyltransferase [Gaiellaceae bacterium]